MSKDSSFYSTKHSLKPQMMDIADMAIQVGGVREGQSYELW
jgi:hypothetical protein